jgi:hypothetical protein
MSVQRTAGALDESHVRRLGESARLTPNFPSEGAIAPLWGFSGPYAWPWRWVTPSRSRARRCSGVGEVIMVNEGMSLPVPCHAATRDNNSDGASRTGAR